MLPLRMVRTHRVPIIDNKHDTCQRATKKNAPSPGDSLRVTPSEGASLLVYAAIVRPGVSQRVWDVLWRATQAVQLRGGRGIQAH